MEKIAIISDVHGNITALNAVLKDIQSHGVNKIFCLGDMLVKCSNPRECVDTILNKCEIVLKGNCEERCVEAPKIDEHYWNQSKLTEEQKQKIIKLPLSYDLYISGIKIRMMHASPSTVHQKAEFWKFDDDFDNRVKLMFENSEYLGNISQKKPDVVIFGHIHKPMILRIDNKMLINPGAVSNTSEIINKNGKSYTFGSYLIIEGEYGSKEIAPINYCINKFTYDFEKEAENIMNTDMPNKENACLEIKSGKYFDRSSLEKKT